MTTVVYSTRTAYDRQGTNLSLWFWHEEVVQRLQPLRPVIPAGAGGTNLPDRSFLTVHLPSPFKLQIRNTVHPPSNCQLSGEKSLEKLTNVLLLHQAVGCYASCGSTLQSPHLFRGLLKHIFPFGLYWEIKLNTIHKLNSITQCQ
jgi:hypothetical protein